jgi:hypothetical protein
MVDVTSLVATAPGELGYMTWSEDLSAGDFAVETIFSGFSAGTELTFVQGTHPAFRRSWDWRRGLFRGESSADIFPVKSLGYMEVARVTESRSPRVVAGKIVGMAYGHRTAHVAGPGEPFCVLPNGLDPMAGVYAATLAPVAANALLHAASVFDGPSPRSIGTGVAGRRVVILGAGAVGLMAAMFCLFHEADEVIVVDRSPERRKVAAALGVPVVPDDYTDLALFCKDRWVHGVGDTGADIVFQTRPRSDSLATGLRCLRRAGVLIDLAFYTDPMAAVWLGEEFHHNGLALIAAQVDNPPRGSGWDRAALIGAGLPILARYTGFLLEHCLTSSVPFHKAADFLRRGRAVEKPDITTVFTF